MPFILGICGFGARNSTRDRITVSAGSLIYETSNLPGDSLSSTSARGSGVSFRVPWYDDPNSSRLQPTGAFWFHGRWYDATNNTNNDLMRLGVGRNGTNLFAISTQDSTHLITIYVAGSLRATAVSRALSLSTWERFHMHVSGYAEGDTVRVYMDGDIVNPVVEYTLTSTDESNLGAAGQLPNEFVVTVPTGHGSAGVDDLIAFDPNASGAPSMSRLIEPSVAELVPTGDGAEQDWGGGFGDIDERPCSDADKITATAAGEESTFTFDPIDADNVFGAKMLARVTRTGTDAGANILLNCREGGTEDGATMAAPGDGDVQHIFQTASDGSDWSAVSFDASRFGFIAAT